MSASNMQSRVASVGRLLSVVAAFAAFVPGPGQAAAPGIVGSSFSLVASAGYTTQPDGALIYTWGYGCASPTGHTYAPAAFQSIGSCPTMQLAGPTPIGTEGNTVNVTLTNNLPKRAGINSIVFSGVPTTACTRAVNTC